MFIHVQLFTTGKKSSAGAIAGGVVAGVVALVLAVVLFLFYRRRKAKQNTLRLGNPATES